MHTSPLPSASSCPAILSYPFCHPSFDSGVPVFAWKGETEEEYEWCIEQSIRAFANGAAPNMILDDGGDLTAMVHNSEWRVIMGCARKRTETASAVHAF